MSQRCLRNNIRIVHREQSETGNGWGWVNAELPICLNHGLLNTYTSKELFFFQHMQSFAAYVENLNPLSLNEAALRCEKVMAMFSWGQYSSLGKLHVIANIRPGPLSGKIGDHTLCDVWLYSSIDCLLQFFYVFVGIFITGCARPLCRSNSFLMGGRGID